MKNNKNSNSNSKNSKNHNNKVLRQYEYFKNKPNHLCNSCVKSSKCERRIQWGMVFGEIHECADYKKNSFTL